MRSLPKAADALARGEDWVTIDIKLLKGPENTRVEWTHPMLWHRQYRVSDKDGARLTIDRQKKTTASLRRSWNKRVREAISKTSIYLKSRETLCGKVPTLQEIVPEKSSISCSYRTYMQSTFAWRCHPMDQWRTQREKYKERRCNWRLAKSGIVRLTWSEHDTESIRGHLDMSAYVTKAIKK